MRACLLSLALLACQDEEPNVAAALAWGGSVDTELSFGDFAGGDHTLAARFFAEHPRGFFGPVFAEDGGGTLFAGTWTYASGQQYLLLQVGTQSQEYPVALEANTWHHLAVTQQGTEVTLWYDGASLSPPLSLASSNTELPTGGLRLGRRTTGRKTVFGGRDRTPQLYGLVDDVAVFDRALSGAEIDALAGEPRMGAQLPSGLVAAFTFDDRLPDGGALPSTHQHPIELVVEDMPWESSISALAPAMQVPVSADRDPVADRAQLLPPFHVNTYYLPFAPGTPWRVGQGYGGDISHTGSAAFALDFNVDGTGSYDAIVTAATSGWVLAFDPNETSGEHADGNNKARLRAGVEDQLYLHVKRDSVYEVGLALGDDVSSGEPFAKVGDFQPDGDGDHLHWAMNTLGAWIPTAFSDWFRFDEATGVWEHVERGIPQQGDLVMAGGSNTVPAVHVEEPPDGAVIPQQALGVRLRATAHDAEDGDPCCGIAWYSATDGFLGSGEELQVGLSPGVHEVFARAVDQVGASSSDRVTITVTEVSPEVTIVTAPGPELVRDVAYTFVAAAPDPADPTQDLCDAVVWSTTIATDDGTATGCVREISFPTSGPHTVTASLTHGGGTSTDTVAVVVEDPPISGPPEVSILSPADGVGVSYLDTLTLRGDAVDPDGDPELTWHWVVTDQDGSVHEVGDAPVVGWVPGDDLSFNCGGTTATIRLEVTDSEALTGTEEVDVFVVMPPC